LPENRSGKISLDAFSQIMALAEEADVVVIGPGLGRSAGLDALVMRLYREVPRPMLIDADGLNALASHSFDRMAESFAQVAESGAWRILTPHPGEFARLVRGQGAGDREPTVSPANISERVVAAREFVTQQNARTEQKCSGEVRTKTPGQCLPTGVPIGGIQTETPSNSGIQTETPGNTCGIVLVLKGCETVVTDGEQIYVNTSGNPGMATAGSGDVLSGMIASLIGQRLSPMDAAKLGVWLHGRSADLALEISHTPHESITASTLIDHIGSAVWEWNAGVASS
ncbi:MAG: NAD(P)H-hydrate dehydratase, partial [Planctomycetaceae bacterium]|nr:NAD(P)H-hydrate dehydratase [Planctomycetaceae bacterium]